MCPGLETVDSDRFMLLPFVINRSVEGDFLITPGDFLINGPEGERFRLPWKPPEGERFKPSEPP